MVQKKTIPELGQLIQFTCYVILTLITAFNFYWTIAKYSRTPLLKYYYEKIGSDGIATIDYHGENIEVVSLSAYSMLGTPIVEKTLRRLLKEKNIKSLDVLGVRVHRVVELYRRDDVDKAVQAILQADAL